MRVNPVRFQLFRSYHLSRFTHLPISATHLAAVLCDEFLRRNHLHDIGKHDVVIRDHLGSGVVAEIHHHRHPGYRRYGDGGVAAADTRISNVDPGIDTGYPINSKNDLIQPGRTQAIKISTGYE